MTSKSSPEKKSAATSEKGGIGKGDKGSGTKPMKDIEVDSFVHVFPDWCKGCGICVEFCPVGVLEMKDQKAIVAHPDKCIRCYLCARRCPDFAIGIADESGRVKEQSKKIEPLQEASGEGGDSK